MGDLTTINSISIKPKTSFVNGYTWPAIKVPWKYLKILQYRFVPTKSKIIYLIWSCPKTSCCVPNPWNIVISWNRKLAFLLCIWLIQMKISLFLSVCPNHLVTPLYLSWNKDAAMKLSGLPRSFIMTRMTHVSMHSVRSPQYPSK